MRHGSQGLTGCGLPGAQHLLDVVYMNLDDVLPAVRWEDRVAVHQQASALLCRLAEVDPEVSHPADARDSAALGNLAARKVTS